MTVGDNTIQVEGLVDFFKNLGKKGLNLSKMIAKTSIKDPRPALEIGANVCSDSASRSPKAALSSLPEVINFYDTGKGLYLGKFVNLVLDKWNKRLIDYTHQHHLKRIILI